MITFAPLTPIAFHVSLQKSLWWESLTKGSSHSNPDYPRRTTTIDTPEVQFRNYVFANLASLNKSKFWPGRPHSSLHLSHPPLHKLETEIELWSNFAKLDFMLWVSRSIMVRPYIPVGRFLYRLRRLPKCPTKEAETISTPALVLSPHSLVSLLAAAPSTRFVSSLLLSM